MKQPHALFAAELAFHLTLQPHRRVDLGLVPRLAGSAADRLGEFVESLDVLCARVLAYVAIGNGGCDAVAKTHVPYLVWGTTETTFSISLNMRIVSSDGQLCAVSG